MSKWYMLVVRMYIDAGFSLTVVKSENTTTADADFVASKPHHLILIPFFEYL